MKPGDDWITACASVIGSGHAKNSAPCQDASVVKVDASGKWVAIVVSDGAGTATRSQEGSSFVAKLFANSLIDLSSELSSRAPGQWINDFVIAKILEARHGLRKKANADDISDYHCTLVACLLGPSGGFAIHIGDGAIFGGRGAQDTASGITELNDGFFISAPENGEYSNETFFVTEGDWIKHLRITPMPRLDWIYACTDGGTALALLSDKEPKDGFIVPVLKEIMSKVTLEERHEVLIDILANPQADKVTDDDKTIALAGRVFLKNSNTLQFQNSGRIARTRPTIEPAANVDTSVPDKSTHLRKSQPTHKYPARSSHFRIIVLVAVLVIEIVGAIYFFLKTERLALGSGEAGRQTRTESSPMSPPSNSSDENKTLRSSPTDASTKNPVENMPPAEADAARERSPAATTPSVPTKDARKDHDQKREH